MSTRRYRTVPDKACPDHRAQVGTGRDAVARAIACVPTVPTVPTKKYKGRVRKTGTDRTPAPDGRRTEQLSARARRAIGSPGGVAIAGTWAAISV